MTGPPWWCASRTTRAASAGARRGAIFPPAGRRTGHCSWTTSSPRWLPARRGTTRAPSTPAWSSAPASWFSNRANRARWPRPSPASTWRCGTWRPGAPACPCGGIWRSSSRAAVPATAPSPPTPRASTRTAPRSWPAGRRPRATAPSNSRSASVPNATRPTSRPCEPPSAPTSPS